MFRIVRSCEQLLGKFPSSPFQSMKTRDLNSVRLMRRGAGPRNRRRGFTPREFVPESLPPNKWKIGGPVLFTVGVGFSFCSVAVTIHEFRQFSGLCICGAAIWEYENFKRNGPNTSLQRRTDSQPFVSQTPIYQPYL